MKEKNKKTKMEKNGKGRRSEKEGKKDRTGAEKNGRGRNGRNGGWVLRRRAAASCAWQQEPTQS